MMQKYEFLSTDTFPTFSASTQVCPSRRVVKNILDFARSSEVVEVEGRVIEMFLN